MGSCSEQGWENNEEPEGTGGREKIRGITYVHL